MNNNDILGTQSQADPFFAQKIAIFGKYLYVDNVDEIFTRIRIRIVAHMRIIRMNCIFRIRMANPIQNTCITHQMIHSLTTAAETEAISSESTPVSTAAGNGIDLMSLILLHSGCQERNFCC